MTDQQALHQYAARNDPEASRLLVENYQRLVYSAAGRRLARIQDIEDVVQTTFLKLARAAGTIRRDLPAWLYSTAVNAANDLIRRDATRRRHESLAATPDLSSDDIDKQEWDKLSLIVDETLLELPELQQTLIVEHFFLGRSQRDLAADAHLQRDDPEYKQKLQRVLDNIKAQIGGDWSIEDRDIDTWEPTAP